MVVDKAMFCCPSKDRLTIEIPDKFRQWKKTRPFWIPVFFCTFFYLNSWNSSFDEKTYLRGRSGLFHSDRISNLFSQERKAHFVCGLLSLWAILKEMRGELPPTRDSNTFLELMYHI